MGLCQRRKHKPRGATLLASKDMERRPTTSASFHAAASWTGRQSARQFIAYEPGCLGSHSVGEAGRGANCRFKLSSRSIPDRILTAANIWMTFAEQPERVFTPTSLLATGSACAFQKPGH